MRRSLFILAAGIVLLALVSWPAGIFYGDADEVLTGLVALRILDDGDAAVFYAGLRHGAVESYLHVLPILLFGASRNTLTFAPFLASCLGLFFFWRLAVHVEGEERAGTPLLFAAFVPAPLLWWTALPNGYALLLALGLAVLWLSARAGEQPTAVRFALLGFVAGLALWASPMALAPAGASVLYLILRARRPAMMAAVPTFLLGFSPWILFNLKYGFASLHSPYVQAGPTNFAKLFGSALPSLLANDDDRIWPLIVLLPAAGLFFVVREARRYFLPGVTAILAMLMFAFSQAAFMAPNNSRYLLFVVPMIAFALGAYRRGWLIAVAVVWICYQSSAYVLPWTTERQARIAKATVQEQLVGKVKARGVRAVSGLYWDVYPISFDTRRAVAAIAYPLDADYHDQRKRAAAPWAAVISNQSAPFMKPALENLGITGTLERIGEYEVLFTDADADLALKLADEAERLWRASL